MRDRITVKIEDGLGRTVTTTSVAAYKDPARQERVLRSILEQTKTRWTHCTEEDRASWGYIAHDENGRLVSYG